MSVIEPGRTIGVLGSGQLGRMLSFSAKRMGYRVHVFSPDHDSPAGQVSDRELHSNFDDLDAVAEFAKSVDVVTFEFENIPIDTVNVVDKFVPVRPGGHVLHTTQNRLREKTFLSNAGLPVPDFQAIQSLTELDAAAKQLTPAVLKTASWGYDGKGQTRINSSSDSAQAWDAVNREEAVLESFVDFECELSVVACRSANGDFDCFGPILNLHENHILDVSICPSGLPQKVVSDAIAIAREVVEKLEVVGVLCVELFLKPDGSLLINELAPRPHNSGHLTIEGHVSNQFDQQLLSVCGFPLASTKQLQPAAMTNILGDCWSDGEPNWRACVAQPGVALHLYGKQGAKPGRKMGHITAVAETTEQAKQLATSARGNLAAPRETNQGVCETTRS